MLPRVGEPIEADVEITEAQCVEAQLAYANHGNHIKSTRKLALIVLGVSGLAAAAAWPPTPGVWTAMMLVLGVCVFLVRLQWAWMGRRAFSALPEARRAYRVRFDEEGVAEVGPKASVRFSWKVVTGWLETESLLVLFSKAGVVGSWTKAAFDEAELEPLKALFEANITPPPAPEPAQPAKKKSGIKTLVVWIGLVLVFVAVYQLIGAER